ncbi:hypothetical protein NP233_g13100 [Leucocoprinus birnbaumii]|uniref:Survival Motor Neuron Gemin2-binding domain-containing protein n=1 Tax=Leucocoprinus birnbaumii TaxID=56174 RepID=A0AAD5VHB0_9AGAR|nr:hypothetical protein NP233_g13100 [Leucocoprinus birnbaumii]
MTSRPLVSYDDITLPYDAPPPAPAPPKSQPPSKKRKRNNHKKQSGPPPQAPQHWDDPERDLDDEAMDDSESRELTHEEIWDDSALIDAWNAAMEEYEAFHGPDKGWKKDPVHKSPLWYNIPPKNLPKKPEPPKVAVADPQADESDSKPIDFDSFVPTHDASLAGAGLEEEETDYATPLTSLPHVSQDEAFQRAVQASYWSGYWTAVYHCHRQAQPTQTNGVDAEGDQDISSSSDEENDEFVSTQR